MIRGLRPRPWKSVLPEWNVQSSAYFIVYKKEIYMGRDVKNEGESSAILQKTDELPRDSAETY